MASEKNLNAVFTDIANAIRGKKGTTDQIKPINMAEEIANLPSGGNTVELSVTQNGIYTPNEGTSYSKVSVSVPQTAESGTLKALLDVGKSCRYLFSGFQGTIIEEGLISYSDTSNVISMSNMFESCRLLTTIPLFDTSKVTTMSYMFNSCYELTTIPLFDTSSVVKMDSMFSMCYALKTIPLLDTSNVKDMSYMFKNSGVTTIPELDVSKVDFMSNIFYGCSSIKSILMTGMKVSFNISSSTKFEESDLVTILNNLATVTSTKTLTMGSTNLAKLTEEDKAIATNKGWTLA